MEKTMYKVSFFSDGIKQITPTKENTNLINILSGIRKGKWRTHITQLRQTLSVDERKYKEDKKSLPYFTVSGTFSKRSNKLLLQHSGLIQIDFDSTHITHLDLDSMRSELYADEYTFAGFISPSGKGLKLIVKIPTHPNDAKHKQSFYALEKYYQTKYGYTIDESCKDVSRAFFISDDPELRFNADAKVFELLESKPSLKAQEEVASKSSTKESPQKPNIQSSSEEAYIQKCVSNTLENAKNLIKTSSNGTKHNSLLKAANLLGGYVGGNLLSSQEAEEILKTEIEKKPDVNSLEDAYKTIREGIKHGAKAPIYKDKLLQERENYHQKSQANTSVHLRQDSQGKGEVIPSKINNQLDFYKVIRKVKDEKDEVRIEINFLKLVEYVQQFGFTRYDVSIDNTIFVKITDNILTVVNLNQILDTVFKSIRELPYKLKDVSKEALINKLYKGINSYFSKQLMYRMTPAKDIVFKQETKNTSYVYFRNGFVEITKSDCTFKQYTELDGYIWDSQIIEHDFSLIKDGLKEENHFYDFCHKISNQDDENFLSLRSIIGYLLHNYKEGKQKAINFTDGSLSMGNDGRSGKTLLAKALGKLRVYCEINGKDFDPRNKHKYQSADLDTQLLNLNDIKQGFSIEHIYNDITEGISVERKNQFPFKVKPKMILCSNRPLKLNSGSDRDRVVEFEFSDYFNESHSPEDEYKHWFFNDWNENQWNKFYNFLIDCIHIHLKKGLIKPKNKQLAQRKLINQTAPEFIEFMSEYEGKGIQTDKEYDKDQLFKDFHTTYTDFDNAKFTKRKFTQWLNYFAEFSEHLENKPVIRRTNANKTCLITFIDKKHTPEQ